MTTTRSTLSFLSILVAIFAGMYLLNLRAQARTQAQINRLTREISQLSHSPALLTGHACNEMLTASVQNNTRKVSSGNASSQPSARERAAANRAQAILQAAISRGVLTRKDVYRMRELRMQSGGGRLFDKLTKKIFQALNEKKMTAEDPMVVVP